MSVPATGPFYITWKSAFFTLNECKLGCALVIYVRFEDGTPLDETTIGEIIGAPSGLKGLDVTGLVDHLQETNNVYPDILKGGEPMAAWARDAWNHWLDPQAAPLGRSDYDVSMVHGWLLCMESKGEC